MQTLVNVVDVDSGDLLCTASRDHFVLTGRPHRNAHGLLRIRLELPDERRAALMDGRKMIF
jgi:hypothetical protein